MLPLRKIETETIPDMETLLYNLNFLIGYFTDHEESVAAATVWQAEQLIKNYLASQRG